MANEYVGVCNRFIFEFHPRAGCGLEDFNDVQDEKKRWVYLSVVGCACERSSERSLVVHTRPPDAVIVSKVNLEVETLLQHLIDFGHHSSFNFILDTGGLPESSSYILTPNAQ